MNIPERFTRLLLPLIYLPILLGLRVNEASDEQPDPNLLDKSEIEELREKLQLIQFARYLVTAENSNLNSEKEAYQSSVISKTLLGKIDASNKEAKSSTLNRLELEIVLYIKLQNIEYHIKNLMQTKKDALDSILESSLTGIFPFMLSTSKL
ncbi:MAG: hypothetical protein MHMPM18_003208 [Marteilia pararefringens]